MKLTGLFIRRPVMTTLLMIGILVFGIVAYTRLPVSDLPTVDYPTISVSASLSGASPETMASTVATPLEKAFSAIQGIDNITSTSSLGSSQVTLQFSLDRDVDAAAQDVNAAISQALPNLPSNIIPPSYRKQNPAASPILFLALTSKVLPLPTLDEYGETTIAQRLSMVDGVAQVSVFGSQKYAVRVEIDPAQLAARGLGMPQVAQAIRQNNVTLPTGVLYGPARTYTVLATGQLNNATQFRNLIVAYKNGAPVHLGELGNVLDDVQNDKASSWYNDERAIVLAVQRQPGTNTVAVATAVKAVLAEIQHEIPSTVEMNVRYDRSVSIERAVHDVKFSLVLALGLVILVIFLFLRNVHRDGDPQPHAAHGHRRHVRGDVGAQFQHRQPVAHGAHARRRLRDRRRHRDAREHRQASGDGQTAAAGGARRRIGSRLHDSLDDAVAGGGIHSADLHGRASSAGCSANSRSRSSAAMIVSGFVSLTLTPMLSSRFLKPPRDVHHGRIVRMSASACSPHGSARTNAALAWDMRHRPLTLVFSVLILVLTAVLFIIVPKGLFPPDDTGLLSGTTEAAQGTSYDEMVRLSNIVRTIVAKDTNVAGIHDVGGFGVVHRARRTRARCSSRSSPKASVRRATWWCAS